MRFIVEWSTIKNNRELKKIFCVEFTKNKALKLFEFNNLFVNITKGFALFSLICYTIKG